MTLCGFALKSLVSCFIEYSLLISASASVLCMSMRYICNSWHLIILVSSLPGSEGINSSLNCCFSSQAREAAGSSVRCWTPGRLSCRCLVSRWVTVSQKESLNELNGNQELKINVQTSCFIFSRFCAFSALCCFIVEPYWYWISEANTISTI